MLHKYSQADAHENDLLRVRDELERFRCDELTCLLLFFSCGIVALMNLQWQNYGFSWSFLFLSLTSLTFLSIYFRTKKLPRHLADKKFAKEHFPAIIINGKDIEFLKTNIDSQTLAIKLDHGGYSLKPLAETDALVCRGTIDKPAMQILLGPVWEIAFPNTTPTALFIVDTTLKTYIKSGAVTWIT